MIEAPRLPKWLLFVRAAAVLLSIAVLVASAYNLSLYRAGQVPSSSPPGFLIFDSVYTLLLLPAMLAAELRFPRLYRAVPLMGLLFLCSVFWLAGWAWAASWSGQLADLVGDDGDDSPAYRKFWGSLTAGAILGAVNWILVVTTTFVFTRACLTNITISDHDGAELADRRKPGEA